MLNTKAIILHCYRVFDAYKRARTHADTHAHTYRHASGQKRGVLKAVVAGLIQGAIRYELVGIFPVQSFFELNTVSGNLVLRNSLLSDGDGRETYTVSPARSTL